MAQSSSSDTKPAKRWGATANSLRKRIIAGANITTTRKAIAAAPAERKVKYLKILSGESSY